jgi:class 3 adenylate cyclase
MLNHYFDVMVKEIISQTGIVDKFMGDCIMAVFKGFLPVDISCFVCRSDVTAANKACPPRQVLQSLSPLTFFFF